jgi:hypothetical protein
MISDVLVHVFRYVVRQKDVAEESCLLMAAKKERKKAEERRGWWLGT